jgi:hypothetical protein
VIFGENSFGSQRKMVNLRKIEKMGNLGIGNLHNSLLTLQASQIKKAAAISLQPLVLLSSIRRPLASAKSVLCKRFDTQ